MFFGQPLLAILEGSVLQFVMKVQYSMFGSICELVLIPLNL